ncbi:MAG: DNA polymerase III subunit delta [Hyphomicrobiales bacterium]
MQLKARDIDQYINNPDQYSPVILVYGPDQGLVSEHCTTLIKKKLEGNDDPFALQSFDSDEIANDPGKLADEASAIALFGGDRVIRLRLNSNRIITKSVKAVLEAPSDTTTLIIEAGDLKKTNPVRSLIEKSKKAMTIPCYADDTRSLQTLIQDELAKANLKISNEARETLLSLIGENRQTTRNELRKLTLYAHGRTEITLNDVEELIGDAAASLSDTTIDLTMSGNTKEALTNFNRSLTMGTAAFQTAHTLQRHLTMLQLLRYQLTNGSQIRDIIDRARPPIHFKRKAIITTQLNLWGPEDIVRAQDHLLTAIKETRLKPQLADTIIHSVLMKLGQNAARNKRRRNYN